MKDYEFAEGLLIGLFLNFIGVIMSFFTDDIGCVIGAFLGFIINSFVICYIICILSIYGII